MRSAVVKQEPGAVFPLWPAMRIRGEQSDSAWSFEFVGFVTEEVAISKKRETSDVNIHSYRAEF